jgi:hypothetical protein
VTDVIADNSACKALLKKASAKVEDNIFDTVLILIIIVWLVLIIVYNWKVC